MNAFVSGSRIYGTPTDFSDIDLVIFTSLTHANMLKEQADPVSPDEESDTVRGSYSLRFSELNLIVCWEEWAYNVWMQGTSQLWQMRPVTRNRAIETFGVLRGLTTKEIEKQQRWTEDDIPF